MGPARVAVGGESAGGNLATVVCLMARDRKGAMPVHQLLIYAVLDRRLDRAFHREFGMTKPLLLRDMPWLLRQYPPAGVSGWERYLSPLRADVSGLPPATVITADDVLRDEGRLYAEKLRASGVPAAYGHNPVALDHMRDLVTKLRPNRVVRPPPTSVVPP